MASLTARVSVSSIGGFIISTWSRGASLTVCPPRKHNGPTLEGMVGCTAPRGYNESTYTTSVCIKSYPLLLFWHLKFIPTPQPGGRFSSYFTIHTISAKYHAT